MHWNFQLQSLILFCDFFWQRLNFVHVFSFLLSLSYLLSFPVTNFLQNSHFEICISYIRVFCGFELSCCRIIGIFWVKYFLDFSCSLYLCVAISVFEVVDLSLSLYWLPLDGTDCWCSWISLNSGPSSTLLSRPCGGILVFLLVPRAHQSGCWNLSFSGR